MILLTFSKLDRTAEVISNMLDFDTRNLDLFEMVKMVLKYGQDRIENYGRRLRKVDLCGCGDRHRQIRQLAF
jgi:hypothetical protein